MKLPKTLKELSRLSAICALTLFAVTACGTDEEKTTDKDPGKTGNLDASLAPTPATSGRPIFVVQDNSGHPLSNASVLIGLSDGKPFAGNRLTTDGRGAFIAPAPWQSSQSVTIEAPGFIRTTFTAVSPESREFELLPQDGSQDLAVDGDAVDFDSIKMDGNVDFGFIMPVLTRQSLLQFDVSQIISPQDDDVKIITGSMKLPSNITLPNQRKILVFPFKLGKPSFRTFVHSPGSYDYVAAHGEFPLATVMFKLKIGQSVFDCINDFDFMSAGFGEVKVTDQGAHIDLPVNKIHFDNTISVHAPTLDAGQIMVAIAFTEKDGKLFPTDVKQVSSDNTQGVKTSSDALQKYVLSMVKAQSSGLSMKWAQLSFALQKDDGKGTTLNPKFLGLIAPPVADGSAVKLTPPAPVDGIQPMGIYLVLSEIETYIAGHVHTERRSRIWEIYTPAWTDKVELPDIPVPKNSQKSYRWDVLFLGREGAPVKGSLFENVTHISRNVVDLQ
jgi:hypothetical protein